VPSKRHKLEKDSNNKVLITIEMNIDIDLELGLELELEDSRDSPLIFRIISKRRELILNTLEILK
jgi:hypothetical protein